MFESFHFDRLQQVAVDARVRLTYVPSSVALDAGVTKRSPRCPGGRCQPGVGLDRDVGFEAVAVGVQRLVRMPRLRVVRRDDLITSGALRDPPLPGPITRLDVLAGHQRQQRRRVSLLVRRHQPVVDQVFAAQISS